MRDENPLERRVRSLENWRADVGDWLREIQGEREDFNVEYLPFLRQLKTEAVFAKAWRHGAIKLLAVAVSLSSIGGFIVLIVKGF